MSLPQRKGERQYTSACRAFANKFNGFNGEAVPRFLVIENGQVYERRGRSDGQ